MSNFIDGYVFPISKDHVDLYKKIVPDVAKIWKEHGALAYHEFVSDGFSMEGIPSFAKTLEIKEGETVVFGWIEFESEESRDIIHPKVSSDPKMASLIAPLVDPENPVFDPSRMVYGRFKNVFI